MIVISDTTPIISLLKADHLEILEKLYGKVLIPEAVYQELIENPAYEREAEIVKKAEFLCVLPIENIKSVSVLRCVTGLDLGESEALIMYDEQKADLLLIDERKGRKVAKQLNTRYIGTAGILMQAYDMGLMQQSEIKYCLETMLENNIRLDRKICNVILSHVGIDMK